MASRHLLLMKILFVAYNLPFPPDNGGKVALYGTVRGASAAGHTVGIVGLLPKGGLIPREYLGQYKIWSMEADFGSRALGVMRNLLSSVPYTYSKCQPAGLMRLSLQAAAEFKPDIVHVECLHVGVFGLRAAECQLVPAILRAQNVDSQLMKRFVVCQGSPCVRAYARLQSWKLRRYERQYLPRFARVVAITDADAKSLAKIGRLDSVSSVPAGVDLEFFEPRLEPEEPGTIMSFALMRWVPNVVSTRWLLERVLPLVRRPVPEVKCYIVGEDPPSDIKRLHDGKTIFVTGRVPDIRPWVARSSVLVVPTRVGSGMRVKLLEALAMGKAVVSTRIGCEGIDGLVDGEHLLIADSEAGFADRVVHLLCDGDLRSRLGAAGRRLVAAKYGWRQVYQSFEETYRNVLDKWTQTGGEAAGPV